MRNTHLESKVFASFPGKDKIDKETKNGFLSEFTWQWNAKLAYELN